MAKETEISNKIKRLQENLKSIRKIAGWTMKDLGDRIGVSKQTVSNWEKTPPTPMNLTQYIAIRAVLDYEIAENKNDVLKQVVTILLDYEEIDEKTYDDVKDKISYVAAAAAGGLSGAALSSAYGSILGSAVGILGAGALGPVGMVAGAVAGAVNGLWLKKLIKKIEKKDK